MRVVIYGDDGPVIFYGVNEIEIQTKHDLIGTPIPDEEWTQGFRFKEGENDVQM